MATTADDPELVAIRAILGALEPLDATSRTRAIQYVLERLGLALGNVPFVSTPSANDPSVVPTLQAASHQPVDIRSFREQKAPRSANEMAAVVAYYLEHEAPSKERQSYVTADDIKKYFHLARFRLPGQPRMTLVNSKNSGYLDQSGTGQYKLNAVGYNLVAHKLPAEQGTSGRARPPRRKKKKGKGKD